MGVPRYINYLVENYLFEKKLNRDLAKSMSDQEIVQEYEEFHKRDKILDLRYKKLKEKSPNLLFKLLSPKYKKLKKLQIKVCKRLNKNRSKLNSLCFEIDWCRDELIRKGNGVEYLSSLINYAV